MEVAEHPLPTPPSNLPDSFDTLTSENPLSASASLTHPAVVHAFTSDVRDELRGTTIYDSTRIDTPDMLDRPLSAPPEENVSEVTTMETVEMVNGHRGDEYRAEDLFSGPAVESPPPIYHPTPQSTSPLTTETRTGVGTGEAQPPNNSESAPLHQQTAPTGPTITTTVHTPPVNTDVEMRDALSPYAQPSRPLHEAPPADEPPAKRFKTEPSLSSADSGKKLAANQQKFLAALLRQVKKSKDARPFLEPVDPVKLNIPRYFEVITRPMDLGTMETKLTQGEYSSAQAFVDDFNMMIDNCVKFNGQENPVTKMAKNIQASFEKGIKTLPPETVSFTTHQTKHVRLSQRQNPRSRQLSFPRHSPPRNRKPPSQRQYVVPPVRSRLFDATVLPSMGDRNAKLNLRLNATSRWTSLVCERSMPRNCDSVRLSYASYRKKFTSRTRIRSSRLLIPLR
jgi:Bromodomain